MSSLTHASIARRCSPPSATEMITKDGTSTTGTYKVTFFLLLTLVFIDNRPYACTVCPVRYYRKYQLTNHSKKKHQTSLAAAQDILCSDATDKKDCGPIISSPDEQVLDRSSVLQKRRKTSKTSGSKLDRKDDEETSLALKSLKKANFSANQHISEFLAEKEQEQTRHKLEMLQINQMQKISAFKDSDQHR